MSNPKRSVTVTQLNRYVATLFDKNKALNKLYVKGELSNVKRYSSRHWYFNIKDENAQIACVMFKSYANQLQFEPKEGQAVLLEAKVTLYEQNGKYQLNVFGMETLGKGNLFQAFEERKAKLEKLGFFAEDKKQALPRFPKKIAVVTSASGAVIRDICHVLKRRFPLVKVLLYPCKVQGPGSAESIVKAIEYLNTRTDIDLMIVGRGGGSIEDLWSFNEEIVAQAAFASAIPIISAVGHETDFTILDFVADRRAPTPSAAAEIAVPAIEDLYSLLDRYEETSRSQLERKLQIAKLQLDRLASNRYLQSPYEKIYDAMQAVDQMEERMHSLMEKCARDKQIRLQSLAERLDILSPLKVLSRGYAMVMDEKEEVAISSIEHLADQDRISLYMQDGKVHCLVESTEKKAYDDIK